MALAQIRYTAACCSTWATCCHLQQSHQKCSTVIALGDGHDVMWRHTTSCDVWARSCSSAAAAANDYDRPLESINRPHSSLAASIVV